jgi:23S rRNA (cytidine1920-2'-O)/16S rRNA (cytidine1409-2'-O)-methyltransferase
MRSRLDLEMTRRGLAESRASAQRLILAGRVRVNSRPAAKPDQTVDDAVPIDLVGHTREYASRGAYKLLAALDHFAITPEARQALDIGASSGGFTDVLLRRGAAHVIALDVGYGQLADYLRTDPRVTVMDRTNIRGVRPSDLPYRPELVVIDVSFISLRLILPPVLDVVARPATLIALVKPQFEVGRGQVGKGGIVRDDARREAALHGILEFATGLGLKSYGAIESPITGAAGNREFLAHFTTPQAEATMPAVRR